MLLWLLLAFTLVPLVELFLLLYVAHAWLGLPGTLALVIVTGTAGAILARHQGVRAIRDIQQAVGAGRMPTDELMAGAATLAGGLMLLTPGILTDLLGFGLLIPPSRALLVGLVKRRVASRIQVVTFGAPTPREAPIKDAEDVRVADADPR